MRELEFSRMVNIEQKIDRAMGVLVGLAAGDRNGGPVQMALRLAQSLIEQQEYRLEDVGLRYLTWWREGAFDTGATTAAVLRLLDEGVPLDQATAQVHRESKGRTAGCNALHRSPPLAMAAFLPLERLSFFGALESSITHWDPLAGKCAVGAVTLCRLLIEGEVWADALRKCAYGQHFQVSQAFDVVVADRLKPTGYAPDVLKAAIHFVHHYEDFDAALSQSMAFAGPANYCPVLVGAIAGARWGAKAIHSSQLAHVKDLALLRSVASELSESWRAVVAPDPT